MPHSAFLKNSLLRVGRMLLPLSLALGVVATGTAAGSITILPDQTCTSAKCHEQFGRGKVVHSAMEDGDCSSCHEQQGEGHEFEYTEEDNDLCFMCHDAFEEKENQHPALEEGCTTCHNPHQSGMKALLEADSMKDLCFICHDDTMLASKWMHGPVELGGCELCHNPHESDHGSLLKESPSTLCLLCHSDIDTALRENRYKHMSAREDCTGCHNPHGAEKEFFLKENIPQLCFGCHGDIEEAIAKGVVKHKIITEDRSCLNCHMPHASKFSSLLKQEAATICNACHATAIDTPTGKIRGVGARVAASPHIHPPVEDGECGSCHNPHGSQNFRLLREKYPESFFVPYSEETYALCFICHDQEFLTVPKTETLTEFRNGTRNLHFWHVTKMNNQCSFCHDAHASSLEILIKETSRFGLEDLPTNFEKTGTGGSCNPGCHETFTYDRENPVSVE